MKDATQGIGKAMALAAILIWLACTALSIFRPASPVAPYGWYILTVALVLFGFGHGARRLGWSATTVLFAIAFVISNLSENSSISTGFPFGFYAHTPAMGPKLLLVPVIIGPIYFGICYLVWTLTEMILGVAAQSRRLAVLAGAPVVAALIVTGFDMCFDPIGATIGRNWIYPHGGGYFGVPISNYVGWFINAWAIFQGFAIFLAWRRPPARPMSPAGWYEAPAFWGLMGLQYPILLMATAGSVVVHDAGGWAWRTGDILQNAAIVSVYTMVAAALISVLTFHLRNGAGAEA